MAPIVDGVWRRDHGVTADSLGFAWICGKSWVWRPDHTELQYVILNCDKIFVAVATGSAIPGASARDDAQRRIFCVESSYFISRESCAHRIVLVSIGTPFTFIIALKTPLAIRSSSSGFGLPCNCCVWSGIQSACTHAP